MLNFFLFISIFEYSIETYILNTFWKYNLFIITSLHFQYFNKFSISSTNIFENLNNRNFE